MPEPWSRAKEWCCSRDPSPGRAEEMIGARTRRLWQGLQTVSGLRQRGYFIPSRHAQASPAPSRYGAIESYLESRQDAFRARLCELDRYRDTLQSFGDAPPPAPRWTQDWFPRLDGAVAYATVRRERPRRIVEIGAGHSTRFFCRAVADEGLDTAIVAIDPAPRAALAGLAALTLVPALVQCAGVAPFAELAAGDVLSIDSSHVLMPGSDVDFLLNTALPLLPAGVHVHFHDVFLPDAYPESWAWRGYNEQLAVALLIGQAGWRVDFAAHYVATRMPEAVGDSVAGALPLVAGARESGIWLTSG